MKHVKPVTKSRPACAQTSIATIFTVIAQILEVVGTMLITKDELMRDPWYDY